MLNGDAPARRYEGDWHTHEWTDIPSKQANDLASTQREIPEMREGQRVAAGGQGIFAERMDQMARDFLFGLSGCAPYSVPSQVHLRFSFAAASSLLTRPVPKCQIFLSPFGNSQWLRCPEFLQTGTCSRVK